MNDYEDNQLKERFGPVMDGLRDLSREIDARRFPGVAWSMPRKRKGWKLLIWPAAAAAIAAAILLGAFVTGEPQGKTPAAGPVHAAATTLEPREDDLLVMELLVGDSAEIDWNYRPELDEEFDWLLNDVPTTTTQDRDG